MTPEQDFQFRNLLSNLLNARVTGESDMRQLAHEDHLRNYVTGLLEEKEAEIATLKAGLGGHSEDVTLQLTRDEAIKMMGNIMSEISERCYCAGWLSDTEEIVPRMVADALSTGKDQEWGLGTLRVYEAKYLKKLADSLGHWVAFNMDTAEDAPEYIAYIPGAKVE